MKVITIKQPFATLIAEGLKQYEFRSWNTKYRGEILIHAGLGVDKKAMEKFKDYNLDYPKGCIIAKANLTDSILIDKKLKELLIETDPLVYSGLINKEDWNGYGFKLENAKKINPIPIKGQLGLWNYK